MKKSMQTVLATAVALASFGAVAGNTATVTVGGNITPASCAIAMNGGGVYDFGVISASSLGKALPSISKGVTINCDADTLVSVSLTDNTTPTTDGGDGVQKFGLGHATSGAATGYYNVNGTLGTLTTAGGETITPARWGQQAPGGTSWGGYPEWKNLFQNYQYVQNKDVVGDTSGPIAAMAQTFSLKITPTLSARDTFSAEDLANDISLAGTATLNMHYL